ncbi:MAG TPA: alpha-galactosidase, partial [Bacteroidales bacterium]|nr:alpha-galactosidase [Bacteroidales bacterium]
QFKFNCLVFALLIVITILLGGTLKAQTISLETKNNALVLQVSKDNEVEMTYYGKKLANQSEYAKISEELTQTGDYTNMLNAAYTPSGTRNLAEPAITVTHSDGNKSLDLKYVSHKVTEIDKDVTLVSVELKDPVYNFMVTLNYKIYFNDDVIEQWSVIKHKEKGNVLLDKFASANLYLKAENYWLRQFHGDWAKELQPEISCLTHGIKTLDSKLGTRADLFQPPFFMLSLNAPPSEDEGAVMLGSLEWSGNFRFDLEVDPLNNLRVIAGINSFASEYNLKPGEEFVTPAFLSVLSFQGMGEASRKIQRWARKYKILDGEGSRLTLLNNWEATYFDFNEEKLATLLKDTKKLGVDMFLLDDGWFGNKYPRNDDRAGLGDWQENKTKLPNGIGWLVKEAKANGVKFGIWLEPEMVNPRSELYEKHPDWVIKQPQRQEYYFRNQLVLDLSNPKVQDFVYGIVDGMLTKNPDLAYIKWDCNAVIYNAASATISNQSHLYVDYVKGLYAVLEKIRAKYPKLPMMRCSGGGGRVDYGALKYFTEYWPSDNTDPLERIFIQWQYSYFFPAIASGNHVTDWGKQPIKFRIDVAMMGKLGFDIVVGKLSTTDLEFCQSAIKTYDSLKHIIWHGDQYRLTDPFKESVASIQYVNESKSEGVVFNYLVNSRFGAERKLPVKLKGLDASKNYAVREINLYPGTSSALKESKVYSGDFLMKVGLNPVVNSWRTSVVLKIEELK